MPSVTLPPGIIPIRSLTTDEILTGHRTVRIRVELLDSTEAFKGRLDGVTGGSLEWTANAAVKGAGSIEVTDVGQTAVDWLTDRIRPVILIDGLPEQPLGVWVVSEAPERWSDTGRTWSVKIIDKLSILDQDAVTETYALSAGTVVTDVVEDLIASTGEQNIAVTPSSATLPAPVVWEAGTTKLKIINELLDAIGYFSLFTDYTGQFRAEPYVRPAARPVRWEFLDDERSIYQPDFDRDVDLYSIPNRVIAVGQGTGDAPALVSVAENNDPSSPYSIPSRGRVIAHVETGVEAADQAALDTYARRRLIELTNPTSSVEISHLFVPGLAFNQVVRWRRTAAGIDARHVISKMVVDLDPTALTRTTITEVVDL